MFGWVRRNQSRERKDRKEKPAAIPELKEAFQAPRRIMFCLSIGYHIAIAIFFKKGGNEGIILVAIPRETSKCLNNKDDFNLF